MTKDTRWGLRRLASLALPALLAGVMAGCDLDEFLDVEDPEVASPGSVRDPKALPVVYAGVIRDFTYAYSGTGSVGGGGANDSQIMLTGLLTDELQHTGTFPTRREVDLRAISTDGQHGTTDNGTLSDAYRNLHRARRAAEQGEELYAAAEAGSSAERSVISSIAGYSYILFGEIYCEGVPYSSIDLEGNVTFGAPSTRTETFNRAIAAFDHAIAIATDAGDKDAEYLARIGKARALLNLNDVAGAAALVAGIPDDWEFLIEHSANTTGENNGIFAYSLNAGRYGVLDGEGGNGLVWSADPRTPVVKDPRDAFDKDNVPVYISQDKYNDRNDPVVLADGREARLIEAEAALKDGDLDGFLDAINAARAVDRDRAADEDDPLNDLVDLQLADIPADAKGRVRMLFNERAHALWLTAHRLGDLRRMIRFYNFGAEEVFPTGAYFRDGLQYGTDVNFPIYVDEINNPEFTGCLNRDA